jgi:N-acetylglutamate synthase-like GNAT family acetyltransferase
MITPEIQIRQATRNDIPVLVQFQQLLARETENVVLDAKILNAGMNAMFDDAAKGCYYVAETKGQVIACHMITYEWSDWRNGMVYWLQSVYVKETFRQHGVFKMMFESLWKKIENDPAIAGLRLYADKTNTRAQKVYSVLGMNGDHYTVFEKMK